MCTNVLVPVDINTCYSTADADQEIKVNIYLKSYSLILLEAHYCVTLMYKRNGLRGFWLPLTCDSQNSHSIMLFHIHQYSYLSSPECCWLSWRPIRTPGPSSHQSTTKLYLDTERSSRSPWTSPPSEKSSATTSMFVSHSQFVFDTCFLLVSQFSTLIHHNLNKNLFLKLQVLKFGNIHH